jgi:XTP/dITP diphosphohydrolase
MALHELVVATGNRGKLAELQALLADLDIRVRSQEAFDVPPVEETGLSFVENAILKARHACLHTGLPALADDSGLAVDALDGAPGVRSARFAGEGAGDAANNRLLLERLAGLPPAQRGARFHCVLALLRNARDPVPLICSGSWAGTILESPRGSGGFGYDPLFLVPGLGLSSAELAPADKNRLSHRGQAFAALREALRTSAC